MELKLVLITGEPATRIIVINIFFEIDCMGRWGRPVVLCATVG